MRLRHGPGGEKGICVNGLRLRDRSEMLSTLGWGEGGAARLVSVLIKRMSRGDDGFSDDVTSGRAPRRDLFSG